MDVNYDIVEREMDNQKPRQSKIEKIMQRKLKLQEELAKIQAQEKLTKEAERKIADANAKKLADRKKFLIGAMVLQQMEDKATEEKILSELDAYLTRSADRAVFGLPDIQETPN